MKLTIVSVMMLLHLIDAYYVDVRLTTSSVSTKNSTPCKSNQVFCSPNCASISKCINGAPRIISTCINGQVCNDDSGPPVCGDKMGLKCFATMPNIFKCADFGFFPDVIACNKYHFCFSTMDPDGTTTTSTTTGPSVYDPNAGFKYFTRTCRNNTIYAPATATCEPNTRPCPTTFPVRLCKSPGDTFQVSGPIYAVCQQYSNNDRILYPFQYRCSVNRFPCPFA
ncbi:hypothetical protein RN001_013135 [Aquatica leii]|uniref:Uncharacterized protein n=1 Tax=Aquatica leii TaxID=1421715 RepID=A0AAN7NW23_9COLE|nr:hypothetical protein RN001_013135 [Aquatica leii]